MSENVENLSADEVGESLKHFDAADYAVFSFMLITCSCVGLYFGYQDHQRSRGRGKEEATKGSEALNYLMGGKNVQVFPGAF